MWLTSVFFLPFSSGSLLVLCHLLSVFSAFFCMVLRKKDLVLTYVLYLGTLSYTWDTRWEEEMSLVSPFSPNGSCIFPWRASNRELDKRIFSFQRDSLPSHFGRNHRLIENSGWEGILRNCLIQSSCTEHRKRKEGKMYWSKTCTPNGQTL